MPYLPDKIQRGKFRAKGKRLYDKYKWKKKSKSYRQKNPWCEVWLALGKYIKCECTDHIVPVEEGGAIYNDENLMAMSNFWHNRKSNLEGRGLELGFRMIGKKKLPLDRKEIIDILIKEFGRAALNMLG